jgi:hypothetical protein
MTERIWFTVIDPVSMLEWVAPRCTDRQLRLYAVACCRRVARLCGGGFEETLVRAEAVADSLPVEPPRAGWRRLIRLASLRLTGDGSVLARALSRARPLQAAREASEQALAMERRAGDTWGEGLWFQAGCLCDIVGNPFRPAAFSPEWCSPTAVAISRGMYESRDFSAMPVLADALQEAGCEESDVLAHCRDPYQPHVRGCWVVDLVLGKA